MRHLSADEEAMVENSKSNGTGDSDNNDTAKRPYHKLKVSHQQHLHSGYHLSALLYSGQHKAHHHYVCHLAGSMMRLDKESKG